MASRAPDVAGVTPDRDAVPARRLASLVGDLTAERPPLYVALAARIRMLVADGRLPVGERLPPSATWRPPCTSAGPRSRVPTACCASRAGPPRDRAPAPGPGSQQEASGAARAVPGSRSRRGRVSSTSRTPRRRRRRRCPAAFGAALEDLPRFLPGHGYHPQGLPDLRARIAQRYVARGAPHDR